MIDALKDLAADAVAVHLITGNLKTNGEKLRPEISNLVFRRANAKMTLSRNFTDVAVKEITEKLNVTEISLPFYNCTENFQKMVFKQNITKLHIGNMECMCAARKRRGPPLSVVNSVNDSGSVEEEEDDNEEENQDRKEENEEMAENEDEDVDESENEDEDMSESEKEDEQEEEGDDTMEPADSDIDNDDLEYIEHVSDENLDLLVECRIVDKLEKLLNEESQAMLTELGIAIWGNDQFVDDDWLEKTLKMLPKLESFLLRNHSLSENGFAAICAHTKITKLNLSEVGLQSLAGISSLTNLIHLEIPDAQFSEASDVDDIFGLEKLQILNIGVSDKEATSSSNLMYYMQCGKVLPELRVLDCFNNIIDMSMLNKLAETHRNLCMVNLIASRLDKEKITSVETTGIREPIVLLTLNDLFQCCNVIRHCASSDFSSKDVFKAVGKEIRRLISLVDPSPTEDELKNCFSAFTYVLGRFCNLENSPDEEICYFHWCTYCTLKTMLEINEEWIEKVNTKDFREFIELTFKFLENFILSKDHRLYNYIAHLLAMDCMWLVRRFIDTNRLARLGAKMMTKSKSLGQLYVYGIEMVYKLFELLTEEQRLLLTEDYPLLHQMSLFLKYGDIEQVQSIGSYIGFLRVIMKGTWRDFPRKKTIVAHTNCLNGAMKYEYRRLSSFVSFRGLLDVVPYAAKESLTVFLKKDMFAGFILLKELNSTNHQMRRRAALLLQLVVYHRKRTTRGDMSDEQFFECERTSERIADAHDEYEKVRKAGNLNFVRWLSRRREDRKAMKWAREYLAEYSKANKKERHR